MGEINSRFFFADSRRRRSFFLFTKRTSIFPDEADLRLEHEEANPFLLEEVNVPSNRTGRPEQLGADRHDSSNGAGLGLQGQNTTQGHPGIRGTCGSLNQTQSNAAIKQQLSKRNMPNLSKHLSCRCCHLVPHHEIVFLILGCGLPSSIELGV